MESSKVIFKSFSSGSCGNCYFLGVGDDARSVQGILIDAGVSLKRLKKELASENLSFDNVAAVLVTHDHMDHIRSLGSYCKHLQKPVWATKELHNALSRHIITHEYIGGCRRVLEDGKWNDIIEGAVSAKYFIVPHDASQTAGFAICIGGHKYVHITDCGKMTREAITFCAQADTVVLESNYDREMLIHGKYPEELKQRILKGTGHMSNDECAEAVKAFVHDGLNNLFLCHLSENNNTPELAYNCTKKALESTGHTHIRLQTLPRLEPSSLIYL